MGHDKNAQLELTGDGGMLDYATALNFGAIPLREERGSGVVSVATCGTLDRTRYAQLRFLLRREIAVVQVDEDCFSDLARRTWTEEQKRSDVQFARNGTFKARVHGETVKADADRVTRFALNRGNEGVPAVELVDQIFGRAISAGASDIHFEPGEESLGVRFRLDGVLQPALTIGKVQQSELLSRLKILAHMDIAEKRRPQDGRIIVEGTQKTVDVRVSSMPTPHGEKIVLRLLDKSRQPLDLAALGMAGRNYDLFREAIRKPNGMILVTGPTGSGKTTTLYGALQDIMSPTINISTVEDPIEYQLPGINQTQMHGDIGYTFANAVRTFLRQDPDVIMIGEIRDPETAKYAIQAAQTGHLVFSTLHTNDAPSAIIRMLEMGMEPYLVASTVHLIMAQRLVRRVCTECGSPRALSDEEISQMRAAGIDCREERRGSGCDRCMGAGFRGRVGVFEIMAVTPSIQELVIEKSSTQRIRDRAVQEGLRLLRNEGLRLVKEGVTTLEEVGSVVG